MLGEDVKGTSQVLPMFCFLPWEVIIWCLLCYKLLSFTSSVYCVFLNLCYSLQLFKSSKNEVVGLDEILLFLRFNSGLKYYKYIRFIDLGKGNLSGPCSDPNWESNQLYRVGIEPSHIEKKCCTTNNIVLLKNTSLT